MKSAGPQIAQKDRVSEWLTCQATYCLAKRDGCELVLCTECILDADKKQHAVHAHRTNQCQANGSHLQRSRARQGCMCVCVCVCVCVCLSVCLSVYLSVCLSVCVSLPLSPSLTHSLTHTHSLSISLSIYVPCLWSRHSKALTMKPPYANANESPSTPGPRLPLIKFVSVSQKLEQHKKSQTGTQVQMKGAM